MPTRVLLVQPDFPATGKSKNHGSSIPIGLLKLASYHRSLGHEVRLAHGCVEDGWIPDEILVTSLFTYWSDYVWQTVAHYKKRYSNARLTVGGVYASLMPEHCAKSGCDEVHVGLHEGAERCEPAYDLIQTDFQIVNTSRGCTRRCEFCGVWKIEPTFSYKSSIMDEIQKNNVLFYDNNLLANPHIDRILEEIATTRVNGRRVSCEAQCGMDGRLLTQATARLLNQARFQYPRIAWDHAYEDHEDIARQIDMLLVAGYNRRDIYVFMLYNFDLPLEELDRNRARCLDWGVQIADCRYRPLNQTVDNYDAQAWREGQTPEDYFIHPNWTDAQIRAFRKQVREQNIVIRHGFSSYSREEELAARRSKRLEGRG